MPNNPHFETLDLSQKIVILASGGRDSTTMVLGLYAYLKDTDQKANVTLICNDTFYNKREARATLRELTALTGFPLIWVKYTWARNPNNETPGEILRDSFNAIPVAVLLKKSKKTYKKAFICCKKLKKDPMTDYLKRFDPENTILLLGIKGGDLALHRSYRMRELRDWGTYYRRQKNGLNYFYPLRDCNEADIARVLDSFGFNGTKASGCNLCPIFCVANWRKKDPESHTKSQNFARQLGIKFEGLYQTDLREYCSGNAVS